jgi:hypothetical protein
MKILFYSIILSIISTIFSVNSISNRSNITDNIPILSKNASANYLDSPNTNYSAGSLMLTTQWDPAVMQSALIKVKLDPAIGSEETIDFCLTEESNYYENTSMPSGYYFLTVQFVDNGITFGGAAELIKIIPDSATKTSIKISTFLSGKWPCLEIIPRSDSIKLTLNNDKNTISSKKAPLINGPTIDSSNIIYTWFVDGILTASGINISELTMPDDLVKGYHRIDLSILSIDGLHGGNATQVYNFQ